jgi:hypothetical protein
VELGSHGEIPGLRLFEPHAEDETFPGFWDRVANLFTLPPLEFDEGAYDDLSGATWSGGNGAEVDGEEWEEDLAETVIIASVVLAIMGLVWLRGFYTRVTDNRRRAEEERMRREGQVGGAPGGAGVPGVQGIPAAQGGWEGPVGGGGGGGIGMEDAMARRMEEWARERREEDDRLRREGEIR